MTEEETKEHDVPRVQGQSPFDPPLYLQRYTFAMSWFYYKTDVF